LVRRIFHERLMIRQAWQRLSANLLLWINVCGLALADIAARNRLRLTGTGYFSMGRLFGFIYILAGTVLAGAAVIAALSLGRDGGSEISLAAAAGAILAFPAAWFISRKLETLR
jgi:hypothetical protein